MATDEIIARIMTSHHIKYTLEDKQLECIKSICEKKHIFVITHWLWQKQYIGTINTDFGLRIFTGGAPTHKYGGGGGGVQCITC